MARRVGAAWLGLLDRFENQSPAEHPSRHLYPPGAALAADQPGRSIDDPDQIPAVTQLPWTMRNLRIGEGQLAGRELTERPKLSLAGALRFGIGRPLAGHHCHLQPPPRRPARSVDLGRSLKKPILRAAARHGRGSPRWQPALPPATAVRRRLSGRSGRTSSMHRHALWRVRRHNATSRFRHADSWATTQRGSSTGARPPG